MDFSGVALGMARSRAAQRGVEVDWIEADVVTWAPPARAYDLVYVLYLQLPALERRAGATLLIVGHDRLNFTEGWGGPTQPDVLFTPDDVVAEIGDLRVEKAQRVRRTIEEPGASREAIDALVRARRLPPS